jgi:hypothetical protein
MVVAFGQGGSAGVDIPGTSYRITNKVGYLNLTTAQATLASTDLVILQQEVEGSSLRPLIDDVHSISILAQTNVSGGLKFTLYLRDNPATKSLVKLCTLTGTGWQLITLPNIPVFPAGNFSSNPGSIGYELGICAAAGSSYQAPAADVWNAGNFTGLSTMDNLGSKPTGSYLYLAFVQHQPGPVCTQLMDLDFQANLTRCQRFFQTSYDYGIKPGGANAVGSIYIWGQANQHPYMYLPYKQTMAKAPVATNAYSNITGAINTVRNNTTAADVTASGLIANGINGFSGFTLSPIPTANYLASFHYTVDTGF